ncbi:hypothetical protein E4K67_02755 [Desulfosporosinus fructosivorans]|uniref:Glutaredoxin n=1 Tax=Desulfosporosinus fructosivorans TaxID=2018669 RepID=A0A4Z0RAN5_9FIRM|nr:hypothetical protein [Desulfosporosinus fructosivorans]TGE39918.1 hypothetical protein E4K67_02755 [Desulfosporosinus fructosivorans]
MSCVLFTATGCTRCKIVKSFMVNKGIPFEEKDMKTDGKEDFKKFYSANRGLITRGKDGVEFPILTDGEVIRQGIGASIAYLSAGKRLDGFFCVGTLHKEWVDGIHPCSGNPENAAELLEVLRFLKKNAMKLQVETTGINSDILKHILEEGLADKVVMNVVGPTVLYSKILRKPLVESDILKSIPLVAQFPCYQFQTTIAPIIRQEGDVSEISYLTPAEIGETAKLIEEGTGSKNNPYLIRMFRPAEAKDERLKSIEPLVSLFPYRTAARAYQVLTEIEKLY